MFRQNSTQLEPLLPFQNPTESQTAPRMIAMGGKRPPSFNHYRMFLLLFFSLILQCCHADIDLPFDLNNPDDKPSNHMAPPNNFDNFYFPSDIVIFHRWIRATSPLNDFRVIENFRKGNSF